jgi:HSP20 family protein
MSTSSPHRAGRKRSKKIMTNEEKKNDVAVATKTADGNPTTEKRMAATPRTNLVPEYRRPFDLMRRFPFDMERMFADFGFNRPLFDPALFALDQPWFETPEPIADFMPAVEMLEEGDNLIVRADLPGMNKEDIDVEVRDNRLIIKGERKNETEEKREGFYKSERTFGTFYRSLPIPETAKFEEAKATFKNGVLEVKFAVPALASNGKRLEITEPATEAKTSTATG